jgi:gamma-glutamylcyclotransferase (GGCT)/AIG2-like uncharacterized protein YtfP
MITNVFAYGSLQIPEVMAAVTGRHFPFVPARLPGYARHSLRGRPYPGLRLQPRAWTEGVVYIGVDARSLARIDRFEDAFYTRRRLAVLVDGNTSLAAEVYVIEQRHYGFLGDESWSLEKFRRHCGKAYLRRCRRRHRSWYGVSKGRAGAKAKPMFHAVPAACGEGPRL